MIYKIIVDKQPMSNPSEDKKEYEIDIEELRRKHDVYDSLVITIDEDYVMRRLSLNEYNALNILPTPIKEPLEGVNIELFEGDNYIYISDVTGEHLYAQYLVKNEFNQLYVTKVEMNSSISQTSQEIMLSVNRKVDGDDFGTYIQQNYQSVKIAWNQISEFIQMMILNGKASLAILDENENVLMSLDNQGQHFFQEGQTIPFGEMGVQVIEENDGTQTVERQYIAFSVNGDYETSINDGMAWGIRTQTDNKFYPILYIRNFEMGSENTDSSHGELELDACDLVLGGMGAGIISGGIKIFGDPSGDKIYFMDIENEEYLMTISLPDFLNGASINILDKISFFKNQAGSNSFRIGDNNQNCILADDGFIIADDITSRTNVYAYDSMFATSFVNTSLEKNKKNFEKLTENEALNIIKNTDIYKYNYKEEKNDKKKHIGFVIGDNYKYSNEITAENKDGKESGADTYSMISAAYKVIQMQQEKIEELEKRIEKLEKGDK